MAQNSFIRGLKDVTWIHLRDQRASSYRRWLLVVIERDKWSPHFSLKIQVIVSYRHLKNSSASNEVQTYYLCIVMVPKYRLSNDVAT